MSKHIINSICQCQRQKKHHYPTCYEWIQLLIALFVPVAIALYTFVQNNNDQAIALANREKDLEIARNQRIQDLKIADDQQKANILAVYESFLVDHLNRYGMTLNESTSARFVARFKTLTAVSQLDRTRKTFLIQSLLEAKLIVNDNNVSDPERSGVISLTNADLSEISLANHSLRYLSLPESNLTRAVFAFSELSCVNFHSAILIDTDFHRASVNTIKNHCFPKSSKYNRTIFAEAKMSSANLFQAEFVAVDFSRTILDHADMHYFICYDCLFYSTKMHHVDMSFSRIRIGSSFEFINPLEAVFVSASFLSTTFVSTTFNRTQAAKAKFEQCSFKSIKFFSCTFEQTLIIQSNFSEANFSDVNLSESILRNVNFTNISMHDTDLSNTIFNQCTFINVDFTGAILLNTSFLNCIFQQSLISNKQRLQAASFSGSTFS